MKIAALLTTFNRKSKTISCINSLMAQQYRDKVSVEIFLTDDSSSDGTAKAIKELFPAAHVFNGNGSLFWAGGMRHTWTKALETKFDFFLLLNDDTVLLPNAVQSLIDSYVSITNEKKLESIIVGTTKETGSNKISYGGKKLLSKYSIKSENVYSETSNMACDLGNANIMLVPFAVVEKTGILSSVYTHGIADYDYTLRAKRNGFGVYVAPGILGVCEDDHGNNWKSANVSLADRIKYLKSPKGLAYHEYLYFIRTFVPMHLPAAFLKLWMKTLFPSLWDRYKTND